MRKISLVIALLLSAASGYKFALIFAAKADRESETMVSKVIPRAQTRRNSGNWGIMDLYTYGPASTYGTENMFTAVADVLPGESVHPAHRHAEEEFLLITRGSGVWSLEGKQFDAQNGDLLYAAPWKMHGLVNTGSDTLTFFVIKWLNKGVTSPPEPPGDHGR